jgi:DNA-binding GntR family transcriptional regulator
MPQVQSNQLIANIQQFIHSRGLTVGSRLPERQLAEELRVSRSPVRSALQLMEQRSLLARRPEGGFVVASAALDHPVALSAPAADENEEEAAYLAIARDRIEGALPEKVTENELMRRYGLTRNRLTAVLRRLVHEGLVERLVGYGWGFTPGLTSPKSYQQSYRFRLLMEPAGILEPTFAVDTARLNRCREEQQALYDGLVFTASPAQIFDANTHLHETIADFSGNMFIVDSLRRLNRVRRLMEYTKAVDREQAHRRCREHLQLIDLLQDSEFEAASDFMRLHLRNAIKDKQAVATS